MKRFAAIILFLLLAANAVGFYAFYFVQLRQIKAAMREKVRSLPEEELQLLTIEIEQYNAALVDDHEIKWQGKMYDIQKVTFEGGNAVIYCVHDFEEDNLLATINVILTRKIDQHKIPVVVTAFIALQYELPVNNFLSRNNSIPVAKHGATDANYTARFISIPTPPPQAS